jgi:hypothetical protein
MDETYRMLGREHEADLEREAQKWRRAADVRVQRRVPATVSRVRMRWQPGRFGPARLISFLVRVPGTRTGGGGQRGPVASEGKSFVREEVRRRRLPA